MARREGNRLDALTVTRLIKGKVAGMHPDGWGLYLVVDANGASRWLYLYRSKVTGKRREMGLGTAMGPGSRMVVPLQRAREKAGDARSLAADGKDPIEVKKAESAVETFGQVADRFLEKKNKELNSKGAQDRAKHALQVICAPIRDLPVNMVDTKSVLSVLEPIWTAKPESARKARGLIEGVLSAAKAAGMRSGDNPATLKGHLDHWLEKRGKDDVEHHPSMKLADLPGFMAALRTKDATSARALEFQILTAARPGEVIGAQWEEIDLKARVRTIPGKRMKAGREHRVPLSPRAIEILEEMGKFKEGAFVFPGGRAGRPMSGAAFQRLLTRMKVADVTPHGFRTTFRQWVRDVSKFSFELGEAAIAHVPGDATVQAYVRSDALEKRRPMMTAWATFCVSEIAKAAQIRREK